MDNLFLYFLTTHSTFKAGLTFFSVYASVPGSVVGAAPEQFQLPQASALDPALSSQMFPSAGSCSAAGICIEPGVPGPKPLWRVSAAADAPWAASFQGGQRGAGSSFLLAKNLRLEAFFFFLRELSYTWADQTFQTCTATKINPRPSLHLAAPWPLVWQHWRGET